MSKVSPFSPFRLEDFPTEREWIDTLFLPLNNSMSEITQALNAQITYGDNIPAVTKVLSGSNLSLPQAFQVSTTLKLTQMVVAQAIKAGSPITMMGAWSQSGDTITVNELFQITASGNIPLAPGSKYTIVLRFT